MSQQTEATLPLQLNAAFIKRKLAKADRLACESKSLEFEVNWYIETCCKSQNLHICDDMQRLLPRELPDMVYAELLGPDPYYKYLTTSHKLTDVGDDFPVFENIGFPEHQEHVRNPAYVGAATYRELAETWYETVQVKLNHRSDVTDLFSYDIWGLDLNPHHHMRNVHIKIKPSTHFNPEVHVFHPADVLMPKNLEYLTGLEKPGKITIFLSFSPWKGLSPTANQVRPWFTRVASIFPVLEQLMTKCTKVKIKVADSEVVEVKKEGLDVNCWIAMYWMFRSG